MFNKPKNINQLYQNNQHLRALINHSANLNKLGLIIQACLPAQYGLHCIVANINNDSVTIIAKNASIASLLRFQSQQICEVISAQLPSPINRINVKLYPKYGPKIKVSRPVESPEMSLESAQLITSIAEHSDDKLKKALIKLASRYKA